MKKLLLLPLLALALTSFAQTNSGQDTIPAVLPAQTMIKNSKKSAEDLPKQHVFRKNIVKINLTSLAFDNYSFSYERSITRKISLVAGYRTMPKTLVSSISLLDKATEELDYEITDRIRSSTISNNTYTGEIRFYTGSKPGARGFYLSLYGRYMDLEASYLHEYETDFRSYSIPIAGGVKGIGGGLMIGSQWLIAKRVAFDWYILGGHYGKVKVDMAGDEDLSSMLSTEQRDLERDIESVNNDLGSSSEIDATVTDQGVQVKGKAPFAGIRGLGFSFGIAF